MRLTAARSRASRPFRVRQSEVHLLEPRRLLSAGDLDPAFGAGGRAVREADGGAFDLVLQANDKTLVAGRGRDLFGGSPRGVTLDRFNPDGSPDASFGPGGRVVIDFGTLFVSGAALALQSDGKIVIAASARGPGTAVLAVTRMLPTGMPDNSFGSGGRATISNLSDPVVDDLALQTDGRIVVVGKSTTATASDSLIVRLLPTGAADNTFSGDGVLVENLAARDGHTGVTIDGAGRIVTVGTSQPQGGIPDLLVSRYTTAGAADTAFGTAGRARLASSVFGSGAVAIDSTGRIVASFTDDSPQRNAVVRYGAAGALDSTFGVNGVAPAGNYFADIFPGQRAPDLAIQFDGDIVVAGTVFGSGGRPNQVAVARLKPNGAYDTTFGIGGTSVIAGDASADREWARAIVLQLDGRIIIAGKVGDIEVGEVSVFRLDAGDVIVPFRLSPDGWLHATGTPGDDVISVSRGAITFGNPDGVVTASANGMTRSYPGADVRGVMVESGNGDDTVTLGPDLQGSASFDGGGGDDELIFSGSEFDEFIRLRNNYLAYGPAYTLPVVDVESITVLGNGGADQINAAEFNRNQELGPVLLTLDGGAGNDLIEGGVRRDILRGGAGNDTIRARGDLGPDTVDGGPGTDSAGTDPNDTVTGVETLLNGLISGAVFSDTDGDGTRDSHEVTVNSFTVYIDTDNDGVLDPTEQRLPTSGPGSSANYQFDYLPAGTYVLRVIAPTTGGWQAINPANASRTITLTVGQQSTGRDFAFRQSNPTASISGTAFNDRDSDGIMEAGEPGIAGRTVYADLDNDGTRDAGEPSAVTDAAGAYRFTNLHSAAYPLRQVVPAGWRQTGPNPAGARTVTLLPDQARDSNNLGTSDKAVISGVIFHDQQGDGIYNSFDTPMPGVIVFADANNNGVLDAGELSTVTNAGGTYFLAPLEAGTHVVRQVPLGQRIVTAPAGGAGHTVTVGAAGAVVGKDFGQAFPVQVAGVLVNDPDEDGDGDHLAGWTVYVDLDDDGVFDAGEPGRVTDAEGRWSFESLLPGLIVVRAMLPSGWEEQRPYRANFQSGSGYLSVSLPVRRVPGIVGRHVFYDNSVFDHFLPGPNVDDELAIATDKRPLLPGQTATFANYTSYSRGLNGIIIDLPTLVGSVSINDFELRVIGGGALGGSGFAPTPEWIHRRSLPGTGLDRLTLTWRDGAIRNQWLHVKVLANSRTRLAAPDNFYFGNLVGDTGDDTGANATVTGRDVLRTRAAALGRSSVTLANLFDFNRDGRVDVRDVMLSRTLRRAPVLQLITATD